MDRLIADTLHHETPAEPWDKESKTRCSNLARFLLEMCIIYDPEALYSSGRPPLLSAVSALLLSLLAHGAPRHYAQMLGDAIHLTEPLGDAKWRYVTERSCVRHMMIT